jgi:hypothetical protein
VVVQEEQHPVVADSDRQVVVQELVSLVIG